MNHSYLDIDELRRNSNRSTDRILKLEQIDGKATYNSTGLIDRTLFTGDNKLHAIMDLSTCLWSCKYERGEVPQVIQQKFTSFKKLFDYLTTYFGKRNVKITEVMD